MSSMPLCDAASSSIMLRDRELLNARHDSHSLHASPEGVRCSQFMVFANMRAHDVLPTPRLPQNRYAWARRSDAMAFLRVDVSARCPTTDSNVEGRYFRADTIYGCMDFLCVGLIFLQRYGYFVKTCRGLLLFLVGLRCMLRIFLVFSMVDVFMCVFVYGAKLRRRIGGVWC